MADALKPWIAKYLLDIAEKYGAQLGNVPTEQKGRKVQLVQFLTCFSENQSSYVWAIASDKSHKLPIRLNAKAVKQYQGIKGKRLTKEKTAIVSIKDFKVIFCRIPTSGQSMSSDNRLALECDAFTVLGSLGEACFGDPNPIEDVRGLKLWVAGTANIVKDGKRSVEEGTNNIGGVEADRRKYEKKWKGYEDTLYGHPGKDEAVIFEELTIEESKWLSWGQVQQILLWTGRRRGRSR